MGASQIEDSTQALNEQSGSIDLAISGISDVQEKRQYAAGLGSLLRARHAIASLPAAFRFPRVPWGAPRHFQQDCRHYRY
jgi:hypothetical protein